MTTISACPLSFQKKVLDAMSAKTMETCRNKCLLPPAFDPPAFLPPSLLLLCLHLPLLPFPLRHFFLALLVLPSFLPCPSPSYSLSLSFTFPPSPLLLTLSPSPSPSPYLAQAAAPVPRPPCSLSVFVPDSFSASHFGSLVVFPDKERRKDDTYTQ